MVALLDAPFYGPSSAYFTGAAASSSLVPDTFHVALNGRPYMVDLNQPFYRQYRRQLAQLIRTQADTSKEPGEQSLDPNSLWRRSFEDWAEGAGQRYADRTDSVPNGFWQSKGIDALTAKWQISLLPDTSKQRTSANTNLQMVAANGYVYISDGQTLLFTSSLAGTVTWMTVTGTPGVAISSICTDGLTVYVAYGASGIYTTTAGSASASNYVSAAIGSAAVLGYVNGRLMLGNSGSGGDGKLYNITAGGASLGTALLAPNNTNATWAGFAEGNNNLYAAVNIGLNAYIYGTATTADGSSLSAPTIQGKLPLGEKVTAIFGYLGELIVGSNTGVRFCQTSTTGGVSLGSLITGTLPNSYGPASSVQALCGYGRWVYFGWTNYDTTSTGLGRMDLENFVVAGALPAFASDLMATAQGAVTGVASLAGVQAFAVSGQGFFVQSTNLVASGTISSGYILYDLADRKIPVLLDVETPGALVYGSYSAAVSADGGAFAAVGLHKPGQPEPVTFGISGVSAVRIEVQLTLNRDGTTTTQGPTVSRFTLRSYPAPKRPLTWQLPLVLNESIANRSSGSQGFDPLAELQALEAMANSAEPVKFQEGDLTFPVFVQDVQFLPDYTTEENVDPYFNGIALVTLVGLPTN